MKVKPILFNTQMVKAILTGNKTVTRRPAKGVTFSDKVGFCCNGYAHGIGSDKQETDRHILTSKYGPRIKKGDLLYVRETWRLFNSSDECGCSEYPCGCPDNNAPLYLASHDDGESKWKPSIHMPRSISRITLKVTDVRVETLNQLRKNQDQVKKEGFENFPRFKHVWQSVYGSCLPNDFVWVIEFEVINKNVDEVLNG